jgi:hypothetical protein
VNLNTLISRGEALHNELGREYYLTGAGLKHEPAFQDIFDRYVDLQSEEALRTVRESGTRELVEWIVDVRVGRRVAALEERQLVWEQRTTLSVDGHTIPYLRVPIELANTPDREFRIALDMARVRAGDESISALRRERFVIERETVCDALECDEYVDAIGQLSGIDLDRLGESAEQFLRATEDMYVDSLTRLVRRRLGVGIDNLVRSDSSWTFRADQFDAAFPAVGLIPTATRQMGEMGLDASEGGRVRFDTDEREGKQPRAFCVPVRVPDEVYLVLRPRGGHSDYRTFWHELGHAMHFASASRDLPFAARWLGDNSVTEGFAMLWDHLTLNPKWLVRYPGLQVSQAHDLTFQLSVSELYLLRRYASKLRYELLLHRSDLSDLGSVYADHLTNATRFRYPEGDALLDVDPGFYAARYLRAWQLEAALASTLTKRFDQDWYRNPRAGAAVRELMTRGQSNPADYLAQQFTGTGLGFESVANRLEVALS